MGESAFRKVPNRGTLIVEAILLQPQADSIDEAMTILGRHRPADEACQAIYARISRAPLEQFELLKAA